MQCASARLVLASTEALLGLWLAGCAGREPDGEALARSPAPISPDIASSALGAPAAFGAFRCDGSPADARELGARIVRELRSVEAKQPRLVGFESWLPPADAIDWRGSVVHERGVTRTTSHCQPNRLCQQRMVFEPSGIYLWIQLATAADVQSQALMPWEQVGPLYLMTIVDGQPDEGTEQISHAVRIAIETTRRSYQGTCKLPH